MDIIFVHGNYPAQFKNLAPILARSEGVRVVFLTERLDAETEPLPDVTIKIFKLHREVSGETHHYIQSTEAAVLKGQALIRELEGLINEGINPKIIITHAGMGYGMFIKEAIPEAIHIGYFEWYFRSDTTQYLARNFDLDTRLNTSMRNLPIIQELERCDIAITPTQWQKTQFPIEFQQKIKVIFDGIDESFFYEQNKSNRERLKRITIMNRETKEKFVIEPEDKVLSYATRGMETLRGFPEFMLMIPKLMEKHKNLKVIIAGKDRRAYSYDAPNESGSWKNYMMEKLGVFEGKERIVFTGLLNYHDYRELLWRSDLHCYFTRPYVTSWSLFEAAACGAKLAVNKVRATEGVMEEESVTWLNLDDEENMVKSVEKALSKRNHKRSKIKKGFGLQENILKWIETINSGIREKA